MLVKSEILEKLSERINKVFSVIKESIKESRPILLRHNADCDGYSGAIALEKAIIPLLQHIRLYRRLPTRAPYYEYADVNRDLSIQDKQFKIAPLIIIVDNGSTKEDVLSIKKARMFDAKVLVIDHHDPRGEDIDSITEGHVNPHLVGGDQNLTSGMLSVEIAKMINPNVKDIEWLAVLSGIGDHSNCDEFDQYVNLAEDEVEFIKELAECLDFEAHYLRSLEARNVINAILGEKRKQFVRLIMPEIKKRKEMFLKSAESQVQIIPKDDHIIAKVDILTLLKQGEYPGVGKASGWIFESLKKRQRKPILLLSCGEDFVTIRSSYEKFDVNKKIKELQEKFDGVKGGGHAVAGTINFLIRDKSNILSSIMQH
jgi:archaea-specific RecJ-like exonuclease